MSEYTLGQHVKGNNRDIYSGLLEAYVFDEDHYNVGLVHRSWRSVSTPIEMLYYERSAIVPVLGSPDPKPVSVLLLHELLLSLKTDLDKRASPIDLLAEAENGYSWEALPEGWEQHIPLFVTAACAEVNRLRKNLYAGKNLPVVPVPVIP
jgi:hypothetical protein